MIEPLYPQWEGHSTPWDAGCYKAAEDAKHVLAWSGGCDSTLLLYDLLKQYPADQIRCVHCIFPWLLKEKIAREKEAMAAAMKRLAEMGFETNKVVVTTITVEYSGMGYHYNGGGLPQAYSWLGVAGMFLQNHCWFYIGAIRGDDVTTLFQQQYFNYFNSVTDLLQLKDIHLCIPYGGCNKGYVLERLIELGLYDCTWYCEDIQKHDPLHPCDACVPCITHIEALAGILIHPIRNDPKIQNKVESLLTAYHNRADERKKEVPVFEPPDESIPVEDEPISSS